ncbi:dihydroxyacetone kinase-like protein [Microbacteriaceae bacterium SG_E_30_P1]|uniref:Dihydroxyacetone kinase-like protein n=1 Tax=Antiquaquibacter oligotrophicus TaxID=2880260 RepID=A0ABT6KQL1_9MICO|nr:DAK2 domain-containing protein [Antiquaquibacter oligotrophicus]MDH6182096.1 dihydroxyacetone kinase-like protein [Antiquaquibacter oligotrophicus]UDF12239.1 DAK2 domain-containing protein [Antiquaquibacter oligotrophicus]
MATSIRDVRELLAVALPALAAHEETLRQLDAALGDGDLGITVRSGSEAVQSALAALPDDAPMDALLRAAGRAFATANPSTFAALVGGGLLAAAGTVPGVDAVDRATASRIAQAVTDRIAERGGAVVGDKTILDALVPSLAILAADDDRPAVEVATAMRDEALARVEETASLRSEKGRAAWVGERSIGQADPGATAYALFLTELVAALEATP